ncbi:MAG: transcriptional regulator, partial [Caulobacteraceae bacterium]
MDWSLKAAAVGERLEGAEGLGVGEALLGFSHHWLGDLPRASRHLEQALRDAAPSRPEATAYFGYDNRNDIGGVLARTLWLRGLPDQARALARDTVLAAETLGQPTTQCVALIWAISVHLWNGDAAQAEPAVDQLARLTDMYALRPYVAVALGYRGGLAVNTGDVHGGIEQLQACLAQLQAYRYELLTNTFKTMLAASLAEVGRREAAATMVRDTLAAVQDHGDFFLLPELLRISAQVEASDPQDAVTRLEGALALSRQHGALSWELRISTDLAELLSRRSDPVR